MVEGLLQEILLYSPLSLNTFDIAAMMSPRVRGYKATSDDPIGYGW